MHGTRDKCTLLCTRPPDPHPLQPTMYREGARQLAPGQLYFRARLSVDGTARWTSQSHNVSRASSTLKFCNFIC